jgi:hypothetical protein
VNTPGVDPYSYLAKVSRPMDTLTQRDQIETGQRRFPDIYPKILDRNKLSAARVQAGLQSSESRTAS